MSRANFKTNEIYIVESGGLCKIGISNDFSKRLISLRTGNPNEIKVIDVIKHSEARLVENKAHEILRDKRRSGEWFACSPNLALSAVKNAIRIINKGLQEENSKFSFIRIDTELQKKIKLVANRFDISLTEYLNILIQEHLDYLEQLKDEKKEKNDRLEHLYPEDD